MTSNLFICKLNALQPLGTAEIEAIEAATVLVRRYKPRQDLILEGDEPGPVFVMLEGWACRYKMLPNGARQITAFLMPGDACDLHIGMLAEMDHGIQAITPATVALISRHGIEAMMRDYPKVARAMYVAQLVDEGTLRAWIVSMGRRSSIERVAHLMCELYLRMHNVGMAADGEIALPLSQVILAEALGMTPVHLNRVLAELRQAEAMTVGRGWIRITDSGKLVQIAGFDENYLHRRSRRATV